LYAAFRQTVQVRRPRWAQELGLEESTELLDTTLVEEKKTDEALTELAESKVNQHAEAA
jgi:ferritin-like metal-binding protein YciE